MVDVTSTLILKADTTDLARGEAALEGLAKEGKRTEAGLNRIKTASAGAGTATGNLNRGMGAATKGSGAFGRSIQNSAFQVGDFAVQVGSGQRASVALAQQLPQLLGGFGVLGAVLGATVAIGVPLITFLRGTKEEAQSLEEILSDLASATTDYSRAAKVAQLTTGQLAQKYGFAAETAHNFALALQEIAQVEAGTSLEKAIKEITGGVDLATTELASGITKFSSLISLIEDIRITAFDLTDDTVAAKLEDQADKLSILAAGIEDYAKTLKISTDDALGFAQALDQFGAAASLDDQIREADELRGFLVEVFGEYKKQPPEIQKIFRELELATRQMLAFKEATDESTAALVRAAFSAQQLYDQDNNVYSGRGGDPRQQQSTLGPDGIQDLIDSYKDPTTPPATMPTGGGASAFAGQIEALNKSLMTERETVEAWRADSLALLEGYNEQELAMMGLHKDARLRIEEEYQERIRGIRNSEQSRSLGAAADFFGSMADVAAQGGEKTVKAVQVFGAAQALINSYVAATQALADPTVPFWGKAAAMASVLAAGLGAVNAIKGVSASGGGGGATAPAAPSLPDTSPRVALTLVGDDNSTFTGKQVRDLINAINEEVEGGAIVRLA